MSLPEAKWNILKSPQNSPFWGHKFNSYVINPRRKRGNLFSHFHHLAPISTLPAMYQFILEIWGDHPINAITPDVWVKLVWYFPLICKQNIQSAPKIHHPGKAKRFTNVGVDPQIRESSRVNLWIHSSPFPILRCDTVAFPRLFFYFNDFIVILKNKQQTW